MAWTITAAEVAREAVDEIQEATTHSAGSTREVVETVEEEVRARGNLERAGPEKNGQGKV
jgi:hypothetical protein